MKVSIVYPPCGEVNLKGYPLGLAYLSASLKKEHEVRIYNYNGKEYDKSIKHFLESLRENKPDLVGVSFNSFNRSGAYQIIRNIKKIDKDIIVVLGGVHPSTLFWQIFQYFYNHIDFVIQSEGESSLLKLCNALEFNSSYRNISGLAYKDDKGGFVANRVSEIIENLDDLPIPDFSYAEDEIKNKEIAYLITSRGCPVNCSFCSTSTFWGQKVRMNSPERIASEVEYVKRLGAKRLFFHDDTFNLGIERTIALAGILKKMDVEYVVQCRVKPVSEEMVAALADSGCKHISWGVESLSDKMLDKINKKITKEEVKKAFDICARYTDRMTSSAYCCVGIPGETEETINETIEYMDKYIKSTHGPGTSILYILPGTKIHQELVKNGSFKERMWVTSGAVYYYTKEHSIRTLNKWRKKINRSGIRVPYSFKYFWDSLPVDNQETQKPFLKRYRKIRKKLRRFINLICNRY